MQFSLTGLEGGKLKLASLKGNVVVVDFWATWCVPCRAQHPLYQRVLDRFKARSDVVFLSIDTDEDHTLVPAFVDANRWSRKVYFEDGLQRLLQVNSIPTTILFDRNGRVASRMNGFQPEKFVDQLTERIESALRE
jgi:thiol-disulfide isomerase/thioredoxin